MCTHTYTSEGSHTRNTYWCITGIVVNISRFLIYFLILISRNGRQYNLCQIFDEKLELCELFKKIIETKFRGLPHMMVKLRTLPWISVGRQYITGKMLTFFLTVHTVWIFSLGALILDTCSNPSYALEQEHNNINFIHFTHCKKNSKMLF